MRRHQIFEGTVLRVSRCFRQWHTDRLEVELQRVSRILKVKVGHKRT